MKKIISGISVVFSACLSFAQTNPTIDAVYLTEGNNICADGAYYNLYVVATDADGDNLSLTGITFANNYIEDVAGFAPVTVGNTTTFHSYITISGTTPPGMGAIVSDDINVTVMSDGPDAIPTVTDALAGVVVNGPVFVAWSAPTVDFCQNALPVDLATMVSPSGGIFTWNEIWPSTTSNSNAFDVKKAYKYFADDGFDAYSMYYTVENVNGCKNTASIDVNFLDVPSISMSTTPSTCGSAIGDASAFISMGMPPYTCYWSNGFSETASSTTGISNLSSGAYYLNVVDFYGCKAVAKAGVSDSDIAVSSTTQPQRCAGQTGMLDLTITPTTGAVNYIYWSNGMTTEDINAPKGEYSVEIHTDANCNYFGTYSIADSILRVKLNNSAPNSSCVANDGFMDIQTIGGTGSGTYSWDWQKNGSFFSTLEDLSGISGGVYVCTVQDANSCSLTWSKTIANNNNVNLYANEVVKATCGNTDGSIDIYIDGSGDTPSLYEWSTGSTSEDLTGLAAGNYTLTYADQAGCTSYLTIKLLNELPYQPSICLLTVDTSLIYNMVVWEKDLSQNIAGFNIYRETSVYSVFEKVATRPFALESFFQDNDASPVDRSWRYYITSYDACGGESYGSFVHKTIHVVSSTSDGINFDLSWDNYEGITYTSIDLKRYDATNGWQIIGDDLPYGTNTFSDTPLVTAGLDYLVVFNLADPCTSSKVQDHNSSRSNKTASAFAGGGSTATIADEDLGIISIYPNPASEILTLHVDSPELFQRYEVRDINGQVVSTGIIYTNNTSIDLSELAGGVYMIHLFTDSKVIVEKFVRQ